MWSDAGRVVVMSVRQLSREIYEASSYVAGFRVISVGHIEVAVADF